jgi:apolipoprotein N-acyltransferase
MIDYGDVLPPIAYLLIVSLVLSLVLMQFGISFLLWKLFKWHPVALPFGWTAAEVLRSNLPYGGFPWLLVGEMLVDFPFLKYYLTAGGVYLGSILLWSGVSLTLVRKKRELLALAGVFLIPLPFLNLDRKLPPDIKVAIVQPNVEENIKLDKELFYKYLPNYWELLEQLKEEKPDIVLLPESAFPFTANKLHSEGKKLLEFSKEFTIVTGLIDIRFMDGWEPYNSVFVIREGKVVDFYDKVRLLPFGEYVPFPFGFAKDIFGAIGGTDYVSGGDPRCLTVNGVKVGTPICFEISYYHLVKKFASCSDFIAVLTNDGWFRDSDGTYQHLRQARVRALENRLYLFWVNNTGPSAVISPEGEIIKEVPYGKKGFIVFSLSGV